MFNRKPKNEDEGGGVALPTFVITMDPDEGTVIARLLLPDPMPDDEEERKKMAEMVGMGAFALGTRRLTPTLIQAMGGAGEVYDAKLEMTKAISVMNELLKQEGQDEVSPIVPPTKALTRMPRGAKV